MQAGSTPFFWQNTTVTFVLHEAADPEISDGTDVAALRRAFETWEEVSTSRIAFYEDTSDHSRSRTDWRDDCPESRLDASIVMGRCDTGVPNPVDESGCTPADRLAGLLGRTDERGRRAGDGGAPELDRSESHRGAERDTTVPGRIRPQDLESLGGLSKRDLKAIRLCLARSHRDRERPPGRVRE